MDWGDTSRLELNQSKIIELIAKMQEDYKKASRGIEIVKVENISSEFQATLNHKYPVAKDFENVYTYLQQRLVEANIKKDTEILKEILMHLRTMRDTWKDVMKQAGAGR